MRTKVPRTVKLGVYTIICSADFFLWTPKRTDMQRRYVRHVPVRPHGVGGNLGRLRAGGSRAQPGRGALRRVWPSGVSPRGAGWRTSQRTAYSLVKAPRS